MKGGGVILLAPVVPQLQAQATGQQSLAGTLGIYVFPSQGQDAKQQAQQATQAQIDGFRKAFSACMEGKQYIAKF